MSCAAWNLNPGNLNSESTALVAVIVNKPEVVGGVEVVSYIEVKTSR